MQRIVDRQSCSVSVIILYRNTVYNCCLVSC